MVRAKQTIFDQVSEKDVKDYADFFEKNKLEEFYLEEDGVRLTLKRTIEKTKVVQTASPENLLAEKKPEDKQLLENKIEGAAKEAPAADKKTYKEIVSPIVGTYYEAPSPDSEAYVQPGDSVKADSKIGIVEAMKIMNEISANVEGKIVEILVKNGDAVTSGQVLMHVE